MHMIIATVSAFAAMTGFVRAFPAPMVPPISPLRNFNGTTISNATALLDNVDYSNSNAVLSAEHRGQDVPGANCKGSMYCKMIFEDCAKAYYKLDPNKWYTNWHNPWDIRDEAPLTGACDGNCGIFIQSDTHAKCDFMGSTLRNGYNITRNIGCEKCGSVMLNEGCRLVVNYVAGCGGP
ncbi:hypothetical protein K490DRAFT_61070 [Saccharata proteae CBS 121410]|uniref:Uncharacterized protein n=1 Tax=Saccharata proteae CBS 121410 TaxID=1314787 RepID=A0A9P4I3V4_9PEZI|nr:hypothetical protein K490DRAFT_61070 [Saccharata proteae CBS 121410]